MLRLVQIKPHLKMRFYAFDDFCRLAVRADVCRKQKRNANRDVERLTLRFASENGNGRPLVSAKKQGQPLPQTSPHRDAPENDAD